MDLNTFRNEQGSSLVLVLLVTLIFTVLGLSLLSATVNGTKRTELREDDVQATYIAEKGVDEIVQSIQTDLINGIGSSGLTIDNYKSLVDQTINSHKSITSLSHQTGVSVAKVINSYQSTNELKRVIEVESTGTVNSESKTINNKLEIGPNVIPDVLKYAVGAYDTCQKKKNNGSCDTKGEGNLFLHGGVAIQGDLKVDGDLITTNQGYVRYGNHDYWIDTYLPTIKSITDPSSKARIVLGGRVINFTNEPPYKSHIDQFNFTANHYNDVKPEQAFEGNDYPIIEKRDSLGDPVVISDNESVYKYTLNDTSIKGEPIAKKSLSASNDKPLETIITDANFSNENVYPYYLDRYTKGNKTYEDVLNFDNTILKKTNSFKRFGTEGSLSLTGNSSSFSTTSSKNGIYVGNDLIIGNPSNTTNNTSSYDKLKVSGPFYVGNDLTIKGANVEFNALMYVKGDVTIEYSVLKGLSENGKTGSLIVFAEGDIHINNNSQYEDTPSYIRGYFYSKGELELFGVDSNFKIDGGISARKIVLNAVKGKVKSSNPGSNQYQKYNSTYFQLPIYQKNEPSRLQITYNPYIVNTYLELKPQESIIKVISDPVPLNRTKK